MESEDFLKLLQAEASLFTARISTDNGDWIVRGFIDVFRRIYTISGDTKVVSKLIELMLLPGFSDFAEKNDMQLVLAREQNHYPDMSFVAKDGAKFAVDLKSTYRKGGDRCNTMTLGSYWGYFRHRSQGGQSTFPYGDYAGHFVLGVVYDRAEIKSDEMAVHTVKELGLTAPVEVAEALAETEYTCASIEGIPSVVKKLQFFAQPKYRIAKDSTGSGNTRNMGAVATLSQLTNGTGPFHALGEDIFDDYWMNFFNKADAKAAGYGTQPYANLAQYFARKAVTASPEVIAEAIAVSEKAAQDAGPDTDEEV